MYGDSPDAPDRRDRIIRVEFRYEARAELLRAGRLQIDTRRAAAVRIVPVSGDIGQAGVQIDVASQSSDPQEPDIPLAKEIPMKTITFPEIYVECLRIAYSEADDRVEGPSLDDILVTTASRLYQKITGEVIAM